MCDQTTQHHRPDPGRQVKVYGVTSKKRVPSLPSIPTPNGQGLKGFEVVGVHDCNVPRARRNRCGSP